MIELTGMINWLLYIFFIFIFGYVWVEPTDFSNYPAASWIKDLQDKKVDKDGSMIMDDIIVKAPWVDIRSYGADAAEADNSAEIQAAIDSISGGRIIVPNACYDITSALDLDDNIEFEGLGRSSKIRLTTNGIAIQCISALVADPKLRPAIRNLTIETDEGTAMKFQAVNYPIVNQVRVINSTIGLQVDKCASGFFKTLHFEDCPTAMKARNTVIGEEGSLDTIWNNIHVRYVSKNPAYGVDFEDTDGDIFNNIVLYGKMPQVAGSVGMRFYECHHIKVSNFSIASWGANGILVDGALAGTQHDFEICNGFIWDIFSATATPRGLYYKGRMFNGSNITMSTIDGHGMHFVDSDILDLNNIIIGEASRKTDNLYSGIELEDTIDVKIVNIQAYYFAPGNQIKYGVESTGTSDRVEISNYRLDGKTAEYSLVGNQNRLNGEYFGAAAPVAGTWKVGDRVWNTAPAGGGTPGWVCVTAGTPGTWKAMPNLAA